MSEPEMLGVFKKLQLSLFFISIDRFYGIRTIVNHVTLITRTIKVDDYHAEAYQKNIIKPSDLEMLC